MHDYRGLEPFGVNVEQAVGQLYQSSIMFVLIYNDHFIVIIIIIISKKHNELRSGALAQTEGSRQHEWNKELSVKPVKEGELLPMSRWKVDPITVEVTSTPPSFIRLL